MPNEYLDKITINNTTYDIKDTTTAHLSDVKINNVSVVSNNEANIVTNTAYDAVTNKIATMSDIGAAGGGTVTSVGIQNGGGLTVSGSPVTSSGTITVGHSNSVTAQSTEAVRPIAIDAQGHISSYGTAVDIPTVTNTYSSTGTDAVSGQAVNAALQTLDSQIFGTLNQAISAIGIVDGKIASSSKIDVGEANQNAFSNVKVGSTTIAADTTTDTLELAAGSGVSLSADSSNDKVTINHSNSVTAQTTQAVYPIAIDAQGHISSYGSAVTIPDAELFVVNATITTVSDGVPTGGTTDKSATEIYNAATSGKLPVVKVQMQSTGVVQLIAPLSLTESANGSAYAVFTYEDQLNDTFQYARLHVTGSVFTITFVPPYIYDIANEDGWINVTDSSVQNTRQIVVDHAKQFSSMPQPPEQAVYPFSYDEAGHITSVGSAVTIPTQVTESTVSGWGFTKNTGTVTGVTAGTGLTGGTISASGIIALDTTRAITASDISTGTDTTNKLVSAKVIADAIADASGGGEGFKVTLSLSGQTYSVDKTFADIEAAVANKQYVYLYDATGSVVQSDCIILPYVGSIQSDAVFEYLDTNGSTQITYSVYLDGSDTKVWLHTNTIGGSGIQSVSGTSPISVSTNSGTATVSHDASGVTAGTYVPYYFDYSKSGTTDAVYFPTITIDSTGHITSASNMGKAIPSVNKVSGGATQASGFMPVPAWTALNYSLDYAFPHIYSSSGGAPFTISAGSHSLSVSMAVGYGLLMDTSGGSSLGNKLFRTTSLYSYNVLGVDAYIYNTSTYVSEPVLVDWNATNPTYNSSTDTYNSTVTVDTGENVPTGYNVHFKIIYVPKVTM